MYGNEKTIEILKGVAAKTKSPVAKELVKDEDYNASLCAAHQLLEEALEEYGEGEMTWDEVVKDLTANLNAIDMPTPPEVEEEKEEKED
jgi:hypothetical protein